jgi:hypothetical protein
MSQWFNTEQLLRPGAVLFTFTRPFQLEAYSASHSQLLLLSLAGDDGLPGPPTRVDVMFKPVRAMRLQQRYDSLTVRCADPDQAAAVLAEHPDLTPGRGEHVFLLDGGGHVIAMAAGFYEDQRSNYAPSAFADGWAEPDGPPWRRLPLAGIDRGLSYDAPSLTEFTSALDDPPIPLAARTKVGTLFVVMLRGVEPSKDIPVDAFITHSEAEAFLATEADRFPAERWIERVRVAI